MYDFREFPCSEILRYFLPKFLSTVNVGRMYEIK